MRVVAVEEHFAAPGIKQATSSGDWATRARDLGERGLRLGTTVLDQLDDLDDGRIADMDGGGIDVQVLSQTQPGVEALPAAEAVPLARDANDLLAAAVARHPTRYVGLATLPTGSPDAAAAELERAITTLGLRGAMINGRPAGRFLDEEFFRPVLEAAEHLRVPLYLHPASPTPALRAASYEGLPPAAAHWLSTAAWGWHVDTGLQVLRLIATGVFDRFPDLQVVIGHMGEAVPFMLERTNATLSRTATGLERQVKEYFTGNFHVSTSGFFSYAPLLCLVLVMGTERVLFAVDYPYSSNREGRAFLDAMPVSDADRERIAHANAEQLFRI